MRVPAALVAILAQAAPVEDLSRYRMEPMGWIFMFGSIGAVIALTSFCYWKVLSRPSATRHMHAPIEIDTKDEGT